VVSVDRPTFTARLCCGLRLTGESVVQRMAELVRAATEAGGRAATPRTSTRGRTLPSCVQIHLFYLSVIFTT
jgi:hypothetical protein